MTRLYTRLFGLGLFFVAGALLRFFRLDRGRRHGLRVRLLSRADFCVRKLALGAGKRLRDCGQHPAAILLSESVPRQPLEDVVDRNLDMAQHHPAVAHLAAVRRVFRDPSLSADALLDQLHQFFTVRHDDAENGQSVGLIAEVLLPQEDRAFLDLPRPILDRGRVPNRVEVWVVLRFERKARFVRGGQLFRGGRGLTFVVDRLFDRLGLDEAVSFLEDRARLDPVEPQRAGRRGVLVRVRCSALFRRLGGFRAKPAFPLAGFLHSEGWQRLVLILSSVLSG